MLSNDTTVFGNALPTSSKKEYHEIFMSNSNGSTMHEVYMLVTLPICLYILHSLVVLNIFQLCGKDCKGKLMTNSLSVVIPYVLFITLLSEYLSEIYVIVVTLVVLTGCNCVVMTQGTKFKPRFRITSHLSDGRHIGFLFISRFRGLVLLLTAICILAADLKIFPRRFVKTDKYGFSLMDLGVGAYALLSGVVGGVRPRNTLLLLGLGVVRTLVLEATQYRTVEAEYGRHCNFFMILAAVRAGGWLLERAPYRGRVLLVAMAALVGLQWQLHQRLGLAARALEDNKAAVEGSLLVANIQTVASGPGFMMLWVIGAGLRRLGPASGSTLAIMVLVAAAAPAVVGPLALLPVSRKLADLGYVFWIFGVSSWLMLVMLVADVVANLLEDRANYVTDCHWPDVYSRVNRRAMLHFLLSNLLTGAANLTIDTHHLSASVSLALLLVYTLGPLILLRALEYLDDVRTALRARDKAL